MLLTLILLILVSTIWSTVLNLDMRGLPTRRAFAYSTSLVVWYTAFVSIPRAAFREDLLNMTIDDY